MFVVYDSIYEKTHVGYVLKLYIFLSDKVITLFLVRFEIKRYLPLHVQTLIIF